jgi:hypothetical protein
MRKPFARKSVALGLIFLLLAGYFAFGVYQKRQKEEAWLLNVTSACLKGREAAMLMGGVIDTMNSPPKPGCPGYGDHTLGEIGTYKLGPYTFHIPRDYLTYGKYKENERESLSLYIEYPSMKPAIKQYSEPGINDELPVAVIYTPPCSSLPCDNYGYIRYRNWILDKSSYQTSNIDQAIFDSKTQLIKFELHKENGERLEIYISGNRLHPDEWYYCKVSVTSPSCISVYELEQNLWVELDFSYRYIAEHQNIKTLLNRKLRNLIVSKE